MTGARTDPSDGELMARVRAGDRCAFDSIMERHKNPLVNYLSRLAGDRERGEDLAQETFVRLFLKAKRYRERGKLRSYLYAIGVNLLRSQQRRAIRWQRLSPLLFAAGVAPTEAPTERILRGEERDAVQTAVAELPLRYREPLTLHELEGWPYQEVADHLGCRVGTVKSRIFRGRRMLQERLEPYWNGGTS